MRLEPAPVFDLDSALFCHAFFTTSLLDSWGFCYQCLVCLAANETGTFKETINPLNLCGNISVKLHRDLPCIGPLSTSQGWALHAKALAVRHRTYPGRRNNLTTLNLLLPCCKHTSLTGCFCLRLLWREDHVLISICCTSTIHLHAHSQGKHSTHCANRSDPCRKAPAFSVRSDEAYTAACTLRRSWTWLICKVGTRTRLRTAECFFLQGTISNLCALCMSALPG